MGGLEVEFMHIGSKIKGLRLKKNLTQEELADRCELTKGYISQLENDLSSPSISTLKDILNALGSSFAEFFENVSSDDKIVFGEQDYFEKISEKMTSTWLVPNAQKNIMEPILVVIAPNSSTEEDLPHEGEEFGYVLQGVATVVVGNNQHTCRQGETFYYRADKTHYIANNTRGELRLIWISSPPNF